MRDLLGGLTQAVPRLYRDFVVMREMGWSWPELMETPLHVVEAAWAFMQEEAAHRARQAGELGDG